MVRLALPFLAASAVAAGTTVLTPSVAANPFRGSAIPRGGAAKEANASFTPVILMHGIDGGPEDWNTLVANLNKAHPGQEVHALDVFSHALSFLPIWDQVPHIATVVRGLTADYDSYHLACHSQGGIVCRALVETMADHKVSNFVSLAGVQQGVRAVPDSYAKFMPGWLQNFTDDDGYKILYTDLGQSISFGNYWRDTASDARASYLQYDALLPVLDNDPEAAATPPMIAGTAAERKANFLRVKQLHLFASPNDTVVEPWDSPLFATVNTSDPSRKTTVPMADQPLYTNDWFGLRTMDEAGRVNATWLPGVEHSMWLSRQDLFDNYLEPLLR